MTTPYTPPPPAVPPRTKKRRLGLKIVGGLVGLIVLIAIISSAAGGSNSDSKLGAATAAKKSPSSGISRGFGTKDASGDVTVGKPAADGFFGKVPVKVVNHSSKRSDYFIDVSLESADGKTQYDTASVFVQAVEPGQSATDEGLFTKTKRIPAGAKVLIKSIQRNASN